SNSCLDHPITGWSIKSQSLIHQVNPSNRARMLNMKVLIEQGRNPLFIRSILPTEIQGVDAFSQATVCRNPLFIRSILPTHSLC
ncbi:MAG: hypothetical protein ACP5Q3_13635, partial [bacterium]